MAPPRGTTPGLVLVTGAAGFIGSNVARAMAGDGARVVACDRMRRGDKWRNLVDVGLHDLVTPEALPQWLERHAGDVRAVVHMGAVSTTTELDVDRIARDNIRATLDLWEWCARTAVPLVYASSAAVYGDGALGFDDDWAPAALARLRPMNAYGWSKLVVDRRVAADVAHAAPTPPFWAGLRFFNVYGPGEEHKGDMRSVVSKLVPRIQAGGAAGLFRSHREGVADGGQQRDFVHVDDVVAVVRWLLDGSAGSTPRRSGVYNVGGGVARSWRDLALAVFAALGVEPRIEYVEMPPALRANYQYYTEARLDRLRQAGWNAPFTSLEDGVLAYVRAAESRR